LTDFQNRLADQLAAGRPVAVGEIGLDTKITECGLAEQLPVLEAQLALAVDLDLPVILHCRGAFEELLTAVGRFGGKLRGVLHAYSRGPELAERFIAAGLHIAFGGAVTRDRARRVRKTAIRVPLDKIVLETDAPSIGLDGVQPCDTEPGHVRDIAAAVAALRGEPLETIAEVTTSNACRLFNLPA
jgi:TatD DNase family protein